ncbi:MAG: SRPBCC family protein [Pseudomonadota bacterium]|nr:SRPBCC family protein [Pseudomonadota bacterium]
MIHFSKWVLAGAGVLAVAASMSPPAAAEVLSAAQNGFEVRETVRVAAAPDKAYAALLQPARWWSSEHTFSGSAANLVLDARAGGCWCETLPEGGSVEHMHVVYVAPGKALRLRGALGPLQGLGADGAMTWTVKGSAGGTEISVSYAVGGYAKDGFDAVSKGVDHVLGEQLERLRKLIDG